MWILRELYKLNFVLRKNAIVKDNAISFKHEGADVRFEFSQKGDVELFSYVLSEVFLNEVYKDLDVRNKIVIDVGASFGDTATYFLLKGAKKVICIEPDQRRYKMLETNMKNKDVNLINEPVSRNLISSLIANEKEKIVLKVDCEGCEYKLISELDKDLLGKFDEMIMEYHSGPDELLRKLHDADFKTKLKPHNSKLGLIYANK